MYNNISELSDSQVHLSAPLPQYLSSLAFNNNSGNILFMSVPPTTWSVA